MDCAVTCDTAFAHVALNMGKPTLLVYDKYVDWRFKVGMYPAAKLLSMTDRDFDKKFHDFVGGTK
jgi:ADP-heptose:LPS heptosyltransferase